MRGPDGGRRPPPHPEGRLRPQWPCGGRGLRARRLPFPRDHTHQSFSLCVSSHNWDFELPLGPNFLLHLNHFCPIPCYSVTLCLSCRLKSRDVYQALESGHGGLPACSSFPDGAHSALPVGLARTPSRQHPVFCSMDPRCPSTWLNGSFLSAVFCSFQSTIFVHVLFRCVTLPQWSFSSFHFWPVHRTVTDF